MNERITQVFDAVIAKHYSKSGIDIELLRAYTNDFLKELYIQLHSNPFVCAEIGEKDSLGLPEKVGICPKFGSDGFAIYTKTSEYSEPQW